MVWEVTTTSSVVSTIEKDPLEGTMGRPKRIDTRVHPFD